MNEIYWITRLDAIDNILLILSFIMLTMTVVFAIVSIVCNELALTGNDKHKEYNKLWRKRGFIISAINAVLCLLFTSATVLTPDTKEAVIIYGVGGTFDYLKQNDTAKQLPDKALKAVDSWIEYITVETKPKKK